MGLENYRVRRDHFEPDDAGAGLDFPCFICQHRHGTANEEPCIRCDWNLNAMEDDDLPDNASFSREPKRSFGESAGSDSWAAGGSDKGDVA